MKWEEGDCLYYDYLIFQYYHISVIALYIITIKKEEEQIKIHETKKTRKTIPPHLLLIEDK